MKIVVFGPVASGKTTLAKILQEELNLPLYQMDFIVHDDENHIRRDEKTQVKMINDIFKKEKEWIIEGTPRNHWEMLSAAATMIIYLDREKPLLRWRLFLRHVKIQLRIEKVPYKLDKDFYKRMLDYINQDQKELLKWLIKRYPTKLVILKKDKEYQKLLKAIKEGEIYKYQ
ncbi:MAG: deoxynucleoside kinase [Bacilli bacterium]|nr:deoxynucleoside kinase [Bacilli bacterium]